MKPVLAARNRCDNFHRIFRLESGGLMGLEEQRKRSVRSGKSLAFTGLAMSVIGWTTITAPSPAFTAELSAQVAALYTTVSIFPPSAKSMTVCYGFVCRRREMLDFTPADRSALSQIVAAGRASAAAGRAGGQKGGTLVEPRSGPGVGTNKGVAKGDFP